MNNCYLYRHIRTDKNCVFYVGIGSHYKKRNKYSRAYSVNRNRFWKNIANKTSYIVEIFLDDLSRVDAVIKEREFIKLYGRLIDNGTLCNITVGGEGSEGMKHSEETKLQMRNKALGRIISIEQRKKASINSTGNKNCVGYKHSDEFRAKCKVAQTGKKMSDQAKKKIGDFWRGKKRPQYIIDKISAKNKGKKVSQDAKDKIRSTLLNRQLEIKQVSFSGNIIATFKTVELAAIKLNRTESAIRNALRSSNLNRTPFCGYKLTRKLA